MKIKLLLGALLFLLFTAEAANAQHYRRGYHRRPGVVVVTPPAPRVVVRHGYYGPRRHGYYRPYRRGYYRHHGYYGRPYRAHGYRHHRRYR